MKLHHTSGSPDWENIPPEARNRWQRVAAGTQGIVTLPNFLSVVGFGLVAAGLWCIVQGNVLGGTGLVAAGRLCDILDGMVAASTGTKSPLGEATDAGFDKLSAITALIVLGVEHIVPRWAVAIIGAQNMTNVIIGIIGRHRRLLVHPVRTGKIATALEWAAFLCFIMTTGTSAMWQWPAYILTGAALLLGIHATISYRRKLCGAPAASAAKVSSVTRT